LAPALPDVSRAKEIIATPYERMAKDLKDKEEVILRESSVNSALGEFARRCCMFCTMRLFRMVWL
jgi:hypothetical protein